jgi:hypothetical protein
MDEGVCMDPRRDEEGRYTIRQSAMEQKDGEIRTKHKPDPQSSKIIGRITSLRDSVKFDAVLRCRNVDRRRNVIRKTAMFVEVKDYQPGIPLVRILVVTPLQGWE